MKMAYMIVLLIVAVLLGCSHESPIEKIPLVKPKTIPAQVYNEELIARGYIEKVPRLSYVNALQYAKTITPVPKPDWLKVQSVGTFRPYSDKSSILRLQDGLFTSSTKIENEGWAINMALKLQNNIFLMTGDESVLYLMSRSIENYLSLRMDLIGMENYLGKIQKRWKRPDRYNMFNYSPFKSWSDPEQILRDRGWQNLNFGDACNSGGVLNEMLRFTQIVRQYGLSNYYEIANQIVTMAQETVTDHDPEFVQISPYEGYYLLAPKNSPYYLDGIEMPYNESAIFGSALIRLYLITHDVRYLNRATQMLNHLYANLSVDKFGYLTYPYVFGDLFLGWTAADNKSLNSPTAPAVRDPEALMKTGVTIEFLLLANLAGLDVTDILQELTAVIVGSSGNYNADEFSLMPYSFSNFYYSDIAYGKIVNGNYSWPYIFLADNSVFNDVFTLISLKGSIYDKVNIAFFAALYGKKLDTMSFITQERSIIPASTDETYGVDNACITNDIFDTSFSLININYKAIRPKHNALYLYIDRQRKEFLRIDVGTDGFNGDFVLRRGGRVCFYWHLDPGDAYSYALPDENVLNITMTSLGM